MDVNKCDPKLGAKIQAHLLERGYENPRIKNQYTEGDAKIHLMIGITKALYCLGIDNNDPSMKDTPLRYAKMFVDELTCGLNYDHFPKCTATPNGELPLFNGPGVPQPRHGGYNQMVLIKGVQVMSLCEHHLQTIDGVAHIAYIPGDKLLGLSKFARVVEFFSRRPQVQERLTAQIYEALSLILETPDIGVVVEATHYCMKARGVMAQNSTTVTDKCGGRFMTNPALRAEMLDAISR